MAKPLARAADHGLATYKGAVGYGQGPLQGQPLVGAATCSTTPVGSARLQGAIANRGQRCRPGDDSDTVRVREED
ncbi:hypothetical protein B296_00011041 [Ensete ventricosum]|uniref:Uncharacterized protein n=1 Tax=Ensete ventricosum TaxID=4639 RepID=A0A426Z3T8_ENSVE|nr:hypothetical protein B296_00011041 [Ensete ventricosum]